VRAEEKQLEGPELEREVHKDAQIESEEREHEQLPQLAGEAVRDLELEHRSRLFDALQSIMDRQVLTVSLLGLPQRETRALEALQTAVNGRDIHMNTFVFSEDRKSLLEQSLAVLQQNLTYGQASQMAELHGRYDELVSRIGTLREELTNLEDAQDDLFEEKRQYVAKHDGDETDETDETDANKADETEPESVAAAAADSPSLYEPALPERVPAPSTLSDEPAQPPAKPPLKRRGKRE
jgi:hypothetical protein